MANTNVTIAKSNVSIFPLPQRTNGFTHKFHIDYTDVNKGTGSTDTVTMTLGTTPTNWIIQQCLVEVTTAFAGPGGFALQVGISTSAAIALASQSVLTAGALYSTNGPLVTNTPASCTGTAAATLQALWTNSVSGSPSALTAGAADIYLSVYDPTKLDVSVTA